MRHTTEKRRGAVAVQVAISLLAIMGVVALALDGGLLRDNKRQVQSAADAAALAAATDLYVHLSSNNGRDPGHSARDSTLATAAANGYANDTTTSVVTVTFAP